MIEPASQGSPFWRFSLRFYRLPRVADACIALQEESGVDVNLLLYLLWQARQCRQLSAAGVAELEAKVSPWREMAVVPLRRLRRALKGPPGLIPATEAEIFRGRIKGIELEAERLQQEAMYALEARVEAEAEPAKAAQANIAAYEAILGVAFRPAAVDILLAGLAALPGEEGQV